MISTEIAAYVLLLSLPLWLLVEQLIHLRKAPRDGQQGAAAQPKSAARTASLPLAGALRSGQK